MPKKHNEEFIVPKDEEFTVPEPETVTTGFIPVRLKPNSRYGRVLIGNAVVERTEVALLTPAQFEEYAEEYDLEVAESEG